MQQILTPVHFEDAVDTLNRINRLYVSDRAFFAIDTLQASKNPAGVGRPNKGKCCKCSANGAVCNHLIAQGFSDYEYILLAMDGTTKCLSYTFAQKVYGVLALGWHRFGLDEAPYWATLNDMVIKRIMRDIYSWLPFVGCTLRLCSQTLGDSWRMKLWGFY